MTTRTSATALRDRSTERVIVLTTLVLVAALLPLVLGWATLFFRDVANFHWPAKLEQARAWQQGVLPFVDLWRGGGQPGLGNLNALGLYPTNLLMAVMPELRSQLWAFNAHFWIHFALGPFAFLWMASELGIGRKGAWLGAVLFATSGFAVSMLSFYNLVPGLLLLPALIAATLRLSVESRLAGKSSGWWVVVTAVVWALLVLAGDPTSAAIGVVAAATALLARGSCTRRGLGLIVLAVISGTLIAWPQINELRLTFAESVRTTLGYSAAGVLRGSVPPVMALDGVLPFVLGAPNPFYWASRLHGGAQPLVYSLFPGAIGLTLALAGLTQLYRSSNTALRLGFLWIAIGAFIALGAHNPLIAVASEWQLLNWLRFPVKLWWLVALGMGLVGASVIESAQRGEEKGANLGSSALSRAIARVAVVLALIYGLVLVAIAGGWFQPLYASAVGGSDAERVAAEALPRLMLAAVVGLALCVILGVLAQRRRFTGSGWALLVLLHAASQLLLLRPLYPTVSSEAFLATPKVLEGVEVGTQVVHASLSAGVGGPVRSATPQQGGTPDSGAMRMVDVQLAAQAAGYPSAGVSAGVRYHLTASPEGLDSYRPGLYRQVVRSVDVASKVRLLEALGAQILIAERPLNERGLVLEAGSVDAYRYLLPAARPLWAATDWVVSETPQEAFESLLDEAFDVTATATVQPVGSMLAPVLDSELAPVAGPSVELLHEDHHRLEVLVNTSIPTLLVTNRAYLPRYRATIDGQAAPPLPANVVRLAVQVPPGKHTVVLEFDRGGWWASVLVSAFGVLFLTGLCLSEGRRSRGGEGSN